MAAGNFSNGGLDTFDPTKHYVGIRLQQGVPLLDRDWNELEDIRRYQESELISHFLGQGACSSEDFRVVAANRPNDVFIQSGRYLLDGRLLSVEGDPPELLAGTELGDFIPFENPRQVLFSEQGARVPLPNTLPGGDCLLLRLSTTVSLVDANDDPDLANSQDINMVTCVRERLGWEVRVTQLAPVFAGVEPDRERGYLARIVRPAGTQQITSEMIEDWRPADINLMKTVFRVEKIEERLTALEASMTTAQADIVRLREEIEAGSWSIKVTTPASQVLFGDKVTLDMQVLNLLGIPVQGATLSLSTDWGTLQPAVITTGADGRASASLVGVQSDLGISAADVARLSLVTRKVAAATLANPGSIEYAKIRFEPDEMALVSRYTPASHLEDLIYDLPDRPIVGPAFYRTATVTVHGQDDDRVRGTGSVQVSFGHWQRDWARTKLLEVVSKVQVGSRIGDVMRQGVSNAAFDHTVVAERLPATLQAISDQTQATVKQSLFADPDLPDDDLRGSGFLGQVITQEATAAIGATAHQAIAAQLDQFVNTEAVQVDEAAQRQLVQNVSQITAGFAQDAKQRFSVSGRIG